MRPRPTIVRDLFLFVLLCAATFSAAQSPIDSAPADSHEMKVILLGSGGGPPVRLKRWGPATLVEAGSEKLLFDCGRGVLLRLKQADIGEDEVTKVFLTHLHSDHTVDLPDLLLSPWASTVARQVPLEVWGPSGTKSMMQHLQEAYAFDIHVRRDLDERFSPEGIKVISHDIEQGTVFERNGVKVIAFLVDHGPVKPAFGYRVEYGGHSVVLSGDTRPTPNLVKFAKGTDVILYEGFDPQAFMAQASHHTREQKEQIMAHHSTPEKVGEIFTAVKPRLAVFYHTVGTAGLAAGAKKTYSGPLEVGEDLMEINIGALIQVRKPFGSTGNP